MKPHRYRHPNIKPWTTSGTTLMIQAPLPRCPTTLPILITIKGRGSGRQGPPPSASAEEPNHANE